jgi:polysaccharide chain length determinant protein (PEP-CTERM system associated)
MGTLLVLARRLAVAAWRHRWPAMALSWLVCGAGWGWVAVIPDQYEASARLYVDADAVLTPLLKGIAIDSALGSQLDVLQRTLLSRPNLAHLVSATDLDLSVTGPADLEALEARLASDIRIVPTTRNLFTISYRNHSAKLAFDVVQAILTTFIESKTGNNRSEMENAQAFLAQQIASYERQLRDAERRRADFRARYVDLLPMGESGASRLEQQEGVVRQLLGQRDDEQARHDMLAREFAASSPLIATETEQVAAALANGGMLRDPRIEAAQRELDDLRLRYTETNPDVMAARARLANAVAASADALASFRRSLPPLPAGTATPAGTRTRTSRSMPNPIYEQLKVRLVESESGLASLQRRLTDAQRERDRLDEIARSAPGLQAEYVNLNRDYDVLRRNYEELLGRRESMRIATAAEADADKIKIQIIDPPVVPHNVVAPHRGVLLSGVLAAGLAAGIGLAVMLVQFDDSFHTIDELRGFGLVVVGGVSLLRDAARPGPARPLLLYGMSLAMLLAVYGGLVWRMLRGPAGVA